MRETDLLAFEIGVRDGNPAGVMCSYNRVNGDYACDNKYLLDDVLKREWKFPGFVLSDWGAAHSIAKASSAGMDHEQPNEYFYGDALKSRRPSNKPLRTDSFLGGELRPKVRPNFSPSPRQIAPALARPQRKPVLTT